MANRTFPDYVDNALIADVLDDLAHDVSGAYTKLAKKAEADGDKKKAGELRAASWGAIDEANTVPFERDALIAAVNDFTDKYMSLAETDRDGR